MIKYLFLLINGLFFFVFGSFGGDDISLTGNIPNSISVGKEVTGELKLNKGNIDGFAKLQLELPAGIFAKESGANGAEYTFENGIAKWTWAELPEESEIVIKFVLLATEPAVGARVITARFSYVENNMKQAVEMMPVEINVIPSSGLKENVLVPSDNKEPSGEIGITRSISSGKLKDELVVDLKIKKGITKGFARYSDDLPEGMNARAINTDGSSFSVADGKLKFVWVNVPEKEEVEISYVLTASGPTQVKLDGEYSYVEHNQSRKHQIPAEVVSLPYMKQDLVTEKQNTVAVTEVKNEKKPEQEKPEIKQEPVKSDVSIKYVIQIGAFTNPKVVSGTLKRKFKITEPIQSETREGFYKFMIGTHPEYKGARDHRENVVTVNGIKSAFVAAYNNGKRITVQEALMIANQKWFR